MAGWIADRIVEAARAFLLLEVNRSDPTCAKSTTRMVTTLSVPPTVSPRMSTV